MSLVCGRGEKIGLERLGATDKRQIEVDISTGDWTVDGTWTYSLRYTSITPLNGSH